MGGGDGGLMNFFGGIADRQEKRRSRCAVLAARKAVLRRNRSQIEGTGAKVAVNR